MIEQIIMEGDKRQIRELSNLYKEILEVKEKFIDLAKRRNLTADQRAEVELKLATLTGDLKATDALIHYLMFGKGDLNSREPAMNLQWQMERGVQIKENEQIMELKDKIEELREKLFKNPPRIRRRGKAYFLTNRL